MSVEITYHWAKDHLLIDLGNRSDMRIRIYYWMELLFTAGLATVFLIRVWPLADWVHLFTVTGAVILYILAGMRFLFRISLREQILLTQNHLTLVRKSLITRKVMQYEWRHMGELHYLGLDQKTDHPLKGHYFDYFGFETNEHFIQNLHRDGSLYFTYHNYPVRFGRLIYSCSTSVIRCCWARSGSVCCRSMNGMMCHLSRKKINKEFVNF
jgi:hypothetical protein